MLRLIDGKLIAEKVKDKVAKEIYDFNGPRPNLAIILIGNRKDSELYVSLKQKEGISVGVDTQLYAMEADVAEEKILEAIEFLNNDKMVDGILIQLPLPKKFDTNKIIKAIEPTKDVDGFHPNHPDYIVSPVFASIMACLEDIKFETEGKTACVLYNAEIFGQGVKKLLEGLGMRVSLKNKSEEADLLVTAMGKPEIVQDDMVKEGAVIIDVGITTTNEGVLGDVDMVSIRDKAAYVTPVPGGIGPMTIAFLFKNVLEIYKRKK